MRIGISVRKAIVNEKEAFTLYKRYIDYFDKHEIVLIMPKQSIDILELCDAFILTGGDDLNPVLYNEDFINCNSVDNDLDELDMLIIEHAYLNDKRLLGICRGIQSINVYFGGSLHQNINNHMESKHKITKVKKSKYFKMSRKVIVNSYHHQVINILPDELISIAKSDDGYIEIIEHKKSQIVGVQFHPEIDITNPFYKEILNFIIN